MQSNHPIPNRKLINHPARTWNFPDEGVKFSNEMECGRLHAVARCEQGNYALTVFSEAEPVHHSAWFAFSVELEYPQSLKIHLRFPQKYHRYRPKLSVDQGKTWREILSEDDAMTLESDGSYRFVLDLPAGQSWVAGQEFMPTQAYKDLLRELRLTAGGEIELIGHSVQGREICAWIRPPTQGNCDYIVVTGGQHPPEIPGAMGLFGFVRSFANGLASAKTGLGIVVIPLINPDGVACGHWRFNANGVDLNRNWEDEISEPETRAVCHFLKQLKNHLSGRCRFFIDFHTTDNGDIFYTFPDEIEGEAGGLKRTWLNQIALRVPEFEVREKAGHNPEFPVSRLWALNNLKCPALTFEYGDNTKRWLIQQTSKVAAEVFFELI